MFSLAVENAEVRLFAFWEIVDLQQGENKSTTQNRDWEREIAWQEHVFVAHSYTPKYDKRVYTRKLFNSAWRVLLLFRLLAGFDLETSVSTASEVAQ